MKPACVPGIRNRSVRSLYHAESGLNSNCRNAFTFSGFYYSRSKSHDANGQIRQEAPFFRETRRKNALSFDSPRATPCGKRGLRAAICGLLALSLPAAGARQKAGQRNLRLGPLLLQHFPPTGLYVSNRSRATGFAGRAARSAAQRQDRDAGENKRKRR